MNISEEETLPDDLRNDFSAVVDDLLPSKSRPAYEKEYTLFQKWKRTKNVNTVNENIVLVYFSEKAKKCKPSTLWTYYSMLKSTILIHENRDISKYDRLIMLLKKLTAGYKATQSRILDPDDVVCFLKDAPDDTYLFMKVVAIIGLHGACRSDELHKLQVCDVVNHGSAIIISIKDTKTKKSRTVCITDKEGEEVSLVKLVQKYAILRPANIVHNKFFINYRDQRCTTQPVGINTIYKVPRNIANFLKLPNPELYTGHCFRRSSASMLANAGVKRESGRSRRPPRRNIEESVAKTVGSDTNNDMSNYLQDTDSSMNICYDR